MRYEEEMIRTGKVRNVYKIWIWKLKWKHLLGELVALKWLLNEKGTRMWTGLIWFMIGPFI